MKFVDILAFTALDGLTALVADFIENDSIVRSTSGNPAHLVSYVVVRIYKSKYSLQVNLCQVFSGAERRLSTASNADNATYMGQIRHMSRK